MEPAGEGTCGWDTGSTQPRDRGHRAQSACGRHGVTRRGDASQIPKCGAKETRGFGDLRPAAMWLRLPPAMLLSLPSPCPWTVPSEQLSHPSSPPLRSRPCPSHLPALMASCRTLCNQKLEKFRDGKGLRTGPIMWVTPSPLNNHNNNNSSYGFYTADPRPYCC